MANKHFRGGELLFWSILPFAAKGASVSLQKEYSVKNAGRPKCSEKSYRNRRLETISREFSPWRDRGSGERKRTINESFRGRTDRPTDRSFNSSPAAVSISTIIRRVELESRALSNCTLRFPARRRSRRGVFRSFRVSNCFCCKIGKRSITRAWPALLYLLFGFLSKMQYL